MLLVALSYDLRSRSRGLVPELVGSVAIASVAAMAAVAVLVDGELLLGALGVAGIIVLQRLATARPPVRARVLGVRQMALGFGVVVLAAAGTWLP
jgi:hypothetical protein